MTLAADLYEVYYNMRLPFGEEKFELVVRDAQQYVDVIPRAIADFCDGGDEGWECGDKEQGEWLNNATVEEISGWVVDGLRGGEWF